MAFWNTLSRGSPSKSPQGMSRLYVLVAAAITVLLFIRLLRVGRRPKGYPPGPPTLPILGNIHQVCFSGSFSSAALMRRWQMPSRDAHLQFTKWAREYGPIYSLILGTKTLIVLSSPEAVKELLDRRSGLYSDRQEMYVGQTLCSGDLRILMMVSFFHARGGDLRVI